MKNSCFPEGNGQWFEEQLGRKVGKGNEVLFWTDAWLNNWKLNELFPRLSSFSIEKQSRVKDMGFWHEGIWVWDLQWRRVLRSHELELSTQLSTFLHTFVPKPNVHDSWVWNANPEGIFTVCSAYICLQGSELSFRDDVCLNLWSTRGSSNVVAFAWRVLHDRIQTRSNLRRRQVIHSVQEARCPFFLQCEESTIHLLFLCPVAWNIWMACYKWLGFSTVLPAKGRTIFSSISFLAGPKLRNKELVCCGFQ